MDRLVPQPEILIFAATLFGVAVFHRHTLAAALAGLTATVVLKLYSLGLLAGAVWLSTMVRHDWTTWTNVVLVLLGFAVLANHFERSGLAEVLPDLLPQNWTGGIGLLAAVFVLSVFLDNIAAAIIGGIMARHYYSGPLGTGFLAAIVAVANAGGAGSVIGDTTTTMMWISGISPFAVTTAFIGATAAFAVIAPLAAWQQARRTKGAPRKSRVDAPAIEWPRAAIVVLLLVALIAVNVAGSTAAPTLYQSGPWLGIGFWIAIGGTALWRKPDWTALRGATPGAFFLAALVALAAMMPVEELPTAKWKTAIGLGFLSAVFDNIPMTALAIKQGGYDWGFLAYTVGFGGSMLWFGSSAGVALSGLYPREARSALNWIREGWFVPLAYACGCAALLLFVGWQPDG
jgi:Na+/H+ antiporter NhaD/arsenite permease-like protein